MKKFFITMALCLAFVGLAQAQLSQGQTYSTKIVTGNRPGAGDWGLYFGPSYSEIVDLVESWRSQDEKAFGLPLINLKYYLNDRAELRFGLQYNGHTTNASGEYKEDYDEIYSYYEENFGTRNIPVTDMFYTRRFRVSPGFAYHFSPKNILDVYVGLSLPIGLDAENSIYETENYEVITNETTGVHSLQKYDEINNYKYSSFVIGLGGFIGLQAFVADLPLSLGFEYGLTGMLRTNDQWYHEVADGEGNSQSFYTTNSGEYGRHFDELTNKSKYMGTDFRFTITYYFNNK
jgi:hypothetical protein